MIDLSTLSPAEQAEAGAILERAVSVRAAYAFDDWPPVPRQARGCGVCCSSGRTVAGGVCLACDGRGWWIYR